MAITPERIAEKVQNAIEATSAFVSALRQEKLVGWQVRFEEIEAALRKGDALLAINLHQRTRYGGMGGLSDHYAQNQQDFDLLRGNCSRAIENVRIYIEHEIDRPIHSANA